jgi:hypothetical protein
MAKKKASSKKKAGRPSKSKKTAARKKSSPKRKAKPGRKAVTTSKPRTRKPAFNAKKDSANDPAWLAPTWNDDVLLGAHVSSAGGTHEAPPRARAIGATAMQLFTKMANRWAERACESDECSAFTAAVGTTAVAATMAHDSYLINLAAPDHDLWTKSIDAFVIELLRAEKLGIPYLVTHPGCYTTATEEGGLLRVIEALDAEASEQFRRIFELGKERRSAWKAQLAHLAFPAGLLARTVRLIAAWMR